MNQDDLESRVLNLEKQVQALHRMNLKLMNREVTIRGLIHTLLNHMTPDQRKALGQTYGPYLTELLQQIPPDLQDREILIEFDEMLSR